MDKRTRDSEDTKRIALILNTWNFKNMFSYGVYDGHGETGAQTMHKKNY